jgi:hypothetical protein
MASEQVTLAAGSISRLTLDAPTGRIVVTQSSGTAAEIFVTADGNDPVTPSGSTEVPDQQRPIPAVLGAQVVLQPPLFGDHMAIPSVRFLSAGTPTVTVEW